MEQVVVHLAKGLKQRGIEPLVICLQSPGDLAPRLDSSHVKVVAIECHRSYDVMGAFRLAKTLRRFAPDVINVHDYSSLPYAVVAGISCFNCPVVFTAHGLLYQGFAGKERRYRLFARGVKKLTAVSQQVSLRHREFLNWNHQIDVVPNGVDSVETSAEIRSEVRKEFGISEDEVVFLAVGNARPEKAFEDLIAAAKTAYGQGKSKPFSVLIAGWLPDNEYCHRLKRDAEESGVKGLRLLGYRDDVQRLYSAADFLVVSSRSEGLPMVVLEAMTAGLPILSTRVGGIADAIPACGGRIVEPADPQALSDAMTEMSCMTRRARIEMGEIVKKHARDQFGIDAMVSGYLNAFDRAKRNQRRLPKQTEPCSDFDSQDRHKGND